MEICIEVWPPWYFSQITFIKHNEKLQKTCHWSSSKEMPNPLLIIWLSLAWMSWTIHKMDLTHIWIHQKLVYCAICGVTKMHNKNQDYKIISNTHINAYNPQSGCIPYGMVSSHPLHVQLLSFLDIGMYIDSWNWNFSSGEIIETSLLNP
jgi:hypothetical protein